MKQETRKAIRGWGAGVAAACLLGGLAGLQKGWMLGCLATGGWMLCVLVWRYPNWVRRVQGYCWVQLVSWFIGYKYTQPRNPVMQVVWRRRLAHYIEDWWANIKPLRHRWDTHVYLFDMANELAEGDKEKRDKWLDMWGNPREEHKDYVDKNAPIRQDARTRAVLCVTCLLVCVQCVLMLMQGVLLWVQWRGYAVDDPTAGGG